MVVVVTGKVAVSGIPEGSDVSAEEESAAVSEAHRQSRHLRLLW